MACSPTLMPKRSTNPTSFLQHLAGRVENVSRLLSRSGGGVDFRADLTLTERHVVAECSSEWRLTITLADFDVRLAESANAGGLVTQPNGLETSQHCHGLRISGLPAKLGLPDVRREFDEMTRFRSQFSIETLRICRGRPALKPWSEIEAMGS